MKLKKSLVKFFLCFLVLILGARAGDDAEVGTGDDGIPTAEAKNYALDILETVSANDISQDDKKVKEFYEKQRNFLINDLDYTLIFSRPQEKVQALINGKYRPVNVVTNAYAKADIKVAIEVEENKNIENLTKSILHETCHHTGEKNHELCKNFAFILVEIAKEEYDFFHKQDSQRKQIKNGIYGSVNPRRCDFDIETLTNDDGSINIFLTTVTTNSKSICKDAGFILQLTCPSKMDYTNCQCYKHIKNKACISKILILDDENLIITYENGINAKFIFF